MKPVVLITGAGRGIGAATALMASRQGYAVCINYRADRRSAELLLQQIRDEGGSAIAVQADVGQEDQVLRLFATVDETLGPLRALVNNAGILEQQCVVGEITAERLQRVFATNVIGPFLCCREAVLRMSTAHGGRGGCIVNVSSVASRLGAAGEYVDYAASKGALDTLTIGLAKEVAAQGIRVNAVRPGLIYTEIHASGGEPGRVARLEGQLPMQRGGRPEEVADSILWLLGEHSSYVTGNFIDVAGGR